MVEHGSKASSIDTDLDRSNAALRAVHAAQLGVIRGVPDVQELYDQGGIVVVQRRGRGHIIYFG